MSDPRILGKYRLVAELARGGMGVVYLAVTSGLGGFSKLVVVKELKPELVEDAGFLEMFLEEARLAAHLNHPNVVPTYEVDIDGKRPFIVMEYLDGQTLARIIRKKIDGFTLNMELRVLLHALDGLQYAHHREQFDGTTISVVHRDVSPQNIFVTYDGQVKVVDFGIAKASDTTVETRTGVFKGKPSYMAPEQLNGEVDPLADVFAVGVILWEALAGRRMWKRRNDVEVLTLLIKGDIPSIDDAAPEAPEELRRIVKKGIAVERSDRYQSARELRDDIERYLEATGDRTTLKEIGALIGGSFAEQRDRLRTIIERCISESKEASSAARSKLPSIAASEEMSAMSNVGVGLSAIESLSALAAQSRPSGPPTPSSFRGNALGQTIRLDPTPMPLSTPPSVTTGTGTGPSGTTQGSTLDFGSGEPRAEPRRLGVLPFVAAGGLGILGLLIIVIVLTMGRRRHLEMPIAAANPPPTEVAAASADPADPPPSPTTPPPAVTPVAPSTAVATATVAATAASVPDSAKDNGKDANVKTATAVNRPTWPHVTPQRVQTPRVAPSTTSAPSPAPSPAPSVNCNPPFYYEGTKKIFKAGCL